MNKNISVIAKLGSEILVSLSDQSLQKNLCVRVDLEKKIIFGEVELLSEHFKFNPWQALGEQAQEQEFNLLESLFTQEQIEKNIEKPLKEKIQTLSK